MRGAEFRPRPIGLPNLSPDGGGGSSGKRHLRLLPGATPLGEPIARSRPGEQRQTEPAKPTLREEINAYLEKRARLRAEGQLPAPEDEPPIITPADVISIDLLEYKLEIDIDNHPENKPKYRSVGRVRWGFNTFAFGKLSHAIQERVTLAYEFTKDSGLSKSRPQMIEQMERLNGEETAIVAELLHIVGLPFELPQEGITIPFAPTVAKMREMVGGEPLFTSLPPANITSISNHPRGDR